ncbi:MULTISPECIES: GNAT family N-acetyltransferase [Lentilactobacillus]|uniref:GNAT family N-acetyltransferase n=1 Tax=Lentilactobacillus TaxID=2767893 RepID=UPI0039EBFED9
MAEEVSFRLAAAKDGQAVLNLLKILQKESNTFLVDSDLTELTPEMESQQIDLISRSKQNLLAVAEFDTDLVGIVTVDGTDQKTGELGVAVLREFQGYTLGTNLVALALDWGATFSSLDELTLTVFSDNAPAIHIYEKLGFEKLKSEQVNDHDVIEMKLNLKQLKEEK